MASVWGELKRRNVVRVAVAYMIIAWLILQVGDTLAPALRLTDRVNTVLAFFLILGFPMAVFFAWAFELTPEGIKKEKDVDRLESVTHVTGRKLDYLIIGVLTVALLMFTLDKFVWTEGEAPIAAANSEQRTIAVLPFINMSSDPEQEYFSDGLAEELLNLLVKIPELRVTSRTSSFAFKGKDTSIADIGRALSVGHILEGSVRRSGDTVRITAQLIDVSRDAHIWSETWDRTFADVFVIQDEIAEAVVDALKLSLLGGTPKVRETTPEAYGLYLQGRRLSSQFTSENTMEAEALVKRAIENDDQFSPAWSLLAQVQLTGTADGSWPPIEGAALARASVAEALRLDADNVDAHRMLSVVAGRYDYDLKTAKRELDVAMKLAPGDSHVLGTAGYHSMMTGDYERSIRLFEEARLLDPLGLDNMLGLGRGNYLAGHFDQAKAILKEAIRSYPDAFTTHYRLGNVMIVSGDYAGALEAYDKEVRDGFRTTGRALLFHAMGDTERADEELRTLLELGITWTYEIAKVYAFRGELDEAFAWLDRALGRRDQGLLIFIGDPFLDNLRDDPRYEVVLERLGHKAR